MNSGSLLALTLLFAGMTGTSDAQAAECSVQDARPRVQLFQDLAGIVPRIASAEKSCGLTGIDGAETLYVHSVPTHQDLVEHQIEGMSLRGGAGDLAQTKIIFEGLHANHKSRIRQRCERRPGQAIELACALEAAFGSPVSAPLVLAIAHKTGYVPTMKPGSANPAHVWRAEQLAELYSALSRFPRQQFAGEPMPIRLGDAAECKATANAAACYASNEILVFKTQRIAESVAHEVGHRMDQRLGVGIWTSLFKERPCYPEDNSIYAASSPVEAYAENVREFVISPVAMQKSCPRYFAHFKQSAFGGRDFRMHWDMESMRDYGRRGAVSAAMNCLKDLTSVSGERFSARIHGGREHHGYIARGSIQGWITSGDRDCAREFTEALIERASRDPEYCAFGERRLREQFQENVVNFLELALHEAGKVPALGSWQEIWSCLQGSRAPHCRAFVAALP